MLPLLKSLTKSFFEIEISSVTECATAQRQGTTHKHNSSIGEPTAQGAGLHPLGEAVQSQIWREATRPVMGPMDQEGRV